MVRGVPSINSSPVENASRSDSAGVDELLDHIAYVLYEHLRFGHNAALGYFEVREAKFSGGHLEKDDGGQPHGR